MGHGVVIFLKGEIAGAKIGNLFGLGCGLFEKTLLIPKTLVPPFHTQVIQNFSFKFLLQFSVFLSSYFI